MIGSDYYYSFNFGKVLKGNFNKSVAINSLLVWILSRLFDNSHFRQLKYVHVLWIHTEKMSENVFNDELDSCTKNLFPCYHENDY